MKTFIRNLSLGALVAGLIGLTGCGSSFMGVALQSMTVSKVDDYFDLDTTQKEQLKKDVESDMKNLKQDVFPQVAKSLRELDVLFSQDAVQTSMVAKIFSDSEAYIKQAATKFEATAVKMSATLSEKQFQHFAEELRDKIEESEDDTKTAAGALKQSMKRYTKSLEFWVGNLNRDQRAQLKEFLSKNPYPWDLQNKSKQAALDQFMNSRKDPEELKKFVKGFVNDYAAYRTAEFKAALKTHQAAFQEFFVMNLWPTVQKSQRQELKENLIARAESLEKLARN